MNLHEKRQIERERKIFVVAKVLVVIITFELYHGGLIDIEQIIRISQLIFFIYAILFSINAQNIHTYCRHMQNIPKKNVLIPHSFRYFFEENHNSPKTSNSFMDCQLECLVS